MPRARDAIACGHAKHPCACCGRETLRSTARFIVVDTKTGRLCDPDRFACSAEVYIAPVGPSCYAQFQSLLDDYVIR